MTRYFRLKTVGVLIFLAWPTGRGNAAPAWHGEIPKVAQDTAKWRDLTAQLLEKDFHFGALAASYRVLTFFSDLTLKEQAYKTIISLIDEGYPFSTRSYFVTGDIEPKEGDAFSYSYNLYKGLVARDKGMTKWAEQYFSNVDKENFPKYLFYSALDAYTRRDLPEAVKLLKKVLGLNLDISQAALAKKVARTLARVYFEQEQYEASFDIYHSLLLRTNSVDPSDWLEASWNLYYLKRFDEALGLLYNLEARSMGDAVNLEKYVVRGLVYQKMCETGRMEALLKTFETDYGAIIFAIKSGESLARLPKLKSIYHPGNAEYYQALVSIRELEREEAELGKVSGRLRDVAKYLYSSELSMLRRKFASYNERAMNLAAVQLVNLAEGLRFLKFDVSRERFNPERVLTVADPATLKSRVDAQQAGFQIHWVQLGDYWRDERPEYRGVLKNRCALK